MKKIFSLFAAVLMAGSMMAADPIVLTFVEYNSADGDGSNKYEATPSKIFATNSNFVSSVELSNSYPARTGCGMKLGTSKANGYLTMTLATPAVFDSIVVSAAAYGNSEGDLAINDGNTINLIPAGNKTFANYKITPADQVTTLKVASVTKRNYVKTITFYPHEVAPVANDTVFFVNAADWAAVKVYAWGGTAARTEWPGLDATKADYQLQSKDVYYFVAAQGAYGKCIFNNNADKQTGNLDWTAGKYYYNGSWMTRAELEAPVVVDIYIKHQWAENPWTWKQMTYDAETETYLLREIYGASGCNWNTQAADAGASWIASPTVVGNPANGDSAVFAFKNGEITITKIGEPSPEPTTRWMKHNWAGLNNWTWKEMTREGETDTYTLRDIYGASGCNWNTIGEDAGATWVATPTLVGEPAQGDSAVFTLVNGEITITKIVVEEPTDDCDWANIEFLGDGAQGGALNNKYKMCAPTAQNIVNIQRPDFAAGAGIYCAFPTGITACSLPEGKYAIQGAGICVYISAFTAEYTDFTVTCGETVHNVTVYYADGQAAPATTYTVTYTVTGFDAEHCGLQAGYFDEAKTVYVFEAGENTVPENVFAFVSTAVYDNYTVEVKVNGTAVTLTNGYWDGAIAADMTIDVTFTAPEPAGTTTVTKTMLQIVNENNYTVSAGNNATCYTSFNLNDVVTISTTGEPNCGSFWTNSLGTDWRLYQAKSGNVIITLAAGYELVSITIDYTNSYDGELTGLAYGVKDTNVSGTTKTYVVGNAGTNTKGQVRIQSISVEYKAASVPTAIDNIEAVKAVKKIENGQVVIIRDGVRYNAVGAKL